MFNSFSVRLCLLFRRFTKIGNLLMAFKSSRFICALLYPMSADVCTSSFTIETILLKKQISKNEKDFLEPSINHSPQKLSLKRNKNCLKFLHWSAFLCDVWRRGSFAPSDVHLNLPRVTYVSIYLRRGMDHHYLPPKLSRTLNCLKNNTCLYR